MIAKERLLAISNLKIENMEEASIEQYEQELVSYIEGFPEEERKIKAALEEKDASVLAGRLEELCVILDSIHAEGIASECRSQISAMKNTEFEKVEAYVAYFLKAAATLSIEIQMAKYLEKDKNAPPPKKKNDADKTILAVDDAAISLTLFKKNMQGSPYKLICLSSGEEALRYIKSHPAPDLFILDIEMPKMNGYELAEKIRDAGQASPIIFLTGNATKRNVLKAIASGASDFLVKPIDKEYLAYKISKHL